MAFRSGSVSGKGIVYSRRKGRGTFGNATMIRNKPSVIYEESEEESDERMKSPLQRKQIETSKAIGNVLKDKSNVTRSPKRQSVGQIERQTGTATNEPPRGRYNSRVRGISSILELSQKPSRGRKTINSSKSRIVSASSIIQEDFELGETLAVIILLDNADLKSEADFEVYSDTPLKLLPSAVEEPSNNVVSSVSAKPQKRKPKPARKTNATRQSKTDASTAKPQPALCLKSVNSASMLNTTSFTQDIVSPVEENVIKDNALMDAFVNTADDVMLFQHPETSQSIEKEHPQKCGTEKRRAGKAEKQSRGRRRPAEIKAFEEERTIADNTNDIENVVNFDHDEVFDGPHRKTAIDNAEMGEEDRVMGSSPPCSPPKIPLEQCFETVLESMTPSRELFEAGYVTPSQAEIPAAPPAVRKPFIFWNSQSRAVEQPFYIASPSPATDMRTEDFVMLRRTRGIIMEDEEDTDILEHRLESTHEIKDEKKGTNKKGVKKKTSVVEKESAKNKGKKWVRFLDVGISCLSDESDDQLAFCKPSWTKKKGKQETGQ